MKLDIKEIPEGDYTLPVKRYHVTVSRRNLLALLTKLDDKTSYKTIYMPTRHGMLYLTAEEDEGHYGHRSPGRMSPRTEADLARISTPADLTGTSSQLAFDLGDETTMQTIGENTL